MGILNHALGLFWPWSCVTPCPRANATGLQARSHLDCIPISSSPETRAPQAKVAANIPPGPRQGAMGLGGAIVEGQGDATDPIKRLYGAHSAGAIPRFSPHRGISGAIGP